MHVGLYDLFVFQAEDGIRDLVRSRGLGDVYKRQLEERVTRDLVLRARPLTVVHHGSADDVERDSAGAVSYTHLTLPTSDLV